MTYVCLWSRGWVTAGVPLDERAEKLLEIAPRVAVEGRGVIWADGRGLPAAKLAWSLVERVGGTGDEVRAGVSEVPVTAELAARADGPRVKVVERGREREFAAPLDLELLEPDPKLRALLHGVGIRSCGALAELAREAVEVRFGPGAGVLWRLARADDRRIIFRPIPPERPQASMDFVEYEVREAGRLVFTVNALLGSVCGALEGRGERARAMELVLGLSEGGAVRERVRCARPTADRAVWLRRLQDRLGRLRLREPVVSVSLEVEETEPRSTTQGDLFDRGFATAGAVEEAVARLLDEHGDVFLSPRTNGHPLIERRTLWIPRPAEDAARTRDPAPGSDRSPSLALQLLAAPRPISVRIADRGAERIPACYLDAGEWQGVATAAGPDRISGGRWEETSFARDYFRCVTEDGRLVWLFRDQREDRWYLHGWWE